MLPLPVLPVPVRPAPPNPLDPEESPALALPETAVGIDPVCAVTAVPTAQAALGAATQIAPAGSTTAAGSSQETSSPNSPPNSRSDL